MVEEKEPTQEEIINEYETSPEYKLKQSEQEEKLDDDQFDAQQGYGYPEPTVKENLFTFWKWFFDLRELIKLNKTANLGDAELHNSRLLEDLAIYNEHEKNNLIRDYLQTRASILLSTSLSKKGFGAQLVGTQTRKVQRTVSGQRNKQGWFSKATPEQTSESE